MLGLPEGSRVEFVADVDYEPYATVRAGEQGVVIFRDPYTRENWIKLDMHHPELTEYDNQVWINWHCADVAECMRPLLSADERQMNTCPDRNNSVLGDVVNTA
jgi:hypothetical protein